MNVLLILGVCFTLAICVTVNGQRVVISNNTSNTTETKLENDVSYSETDDYAISSLPNFTVNETVPDMVLEEHVCKIQANGCDRSTGLCFPELQCIIINFFNSCRLVGNLSTYASYKKMNCTGYALYSESHVYTEYHGYIKNILCNLSQVPEVQWCSPPIKLRHGGAEFSSLVRLRFSYSKQVEYVLPVSIPFLLYICLQDSSSIWNLYILNKLRFNHNKAINLTFSRYQRNVIIVFNLVLWYCMKYYYIRTC